MCERNYKPHHSYKNLATQMPHKAARLHHETRASMGTHPLIAGTAHQRIARKLAFCSCLPHVKGYSLLRRPGNDQRAMSDKPLQQLDRE